MVPVQKSDSCQLQLEQTQKHPFPTHIMLRLFSFDIHAIQNSPWPQEHLSSLLQSTTCWNLNRKSRFNALSTCEWQLYPQGSLGATLIGPSAPTRFGVGKTGTNQVWKVLRPAPYEIWQRTFLKVQYEPCMELSTDEILSSLSLFRVERSIPMLKSHRSLIKTFSNFLYIHNFWKSLEAMTKIWQVKLFNTKFFAKMLFSDQNRSFPWLLRVFEFSCLNVILCLLVRYQAETQKLEICFLCTS